MKQIPTWADLVAERVRREGFRAYVRFFWEICDGSPFRPNWHADAIADHLQAVHDYEIMRLAICMPPRLGKEIACDTPMLTNRGWVAAGDVMIGDQLIGSNGRWTNVIGVWPQGQKQLYRVSFSDGTSLEAGAEHLWEVHSHGGGANRKLKPSKLNRFGQPRHVKTTSDLMAAGLYHDGRRKRFEIPVVDALELTETSLTMDPYLLGCWLGDGSKRAAVVTSMDSEIIAAFDAVYERGRQFTCKGRAVAVSWVDGMLADLQALGVVDRKHIPPEYLDASKSQRLALLQGLLDTDGSVYKDGTIEFTNTNRDLIDGVSWLVRSLGGVAKVTQTRAHQRQFPQAADAWRVNIHLPADVIPFRLSRKVARLQNYGNRSRPRRKISAIDPSRVAEAVCYTVDAEDHLFCAGRELIVTHNSRLCSELFPAYIWADRPNEHILNASYDIGLVTGFATSSVDIIQSELHQQAFPGTSIPAHYRKSDFKNHQGGRRISTIMAGRSTGLGSHIQIIDDPVKASAANGDDPKILQNAISHIDGALSTRAVGDPELFRRVLVMQRLHPKDAAGHVIQDLGWEALVLPMEYSRTVQWDCMSSLQFRDPRSEDGDLLFPGLWSRKAVDRLKIELAGQSGGSVKFVSSQLQQNPQVDGGSFVDAGWFGLTRELPWKLPREAYYFSVTDPGHKGTKTSNSRTAMGFFAIHNSRLYWLDAIAQHLRYPDFKDEFLRLHSPGGPWELAQSIRVEDTVNGSPLLAELGWGRDTNDPAVRQTFPFAHRLVGLSPPTAAKEERFRPQTDLIRQGLLSLYDGAWNQDVIHEVTSFPGGQHDDLVDVLTMALEHFRERTSRTNWANIAKIRR